MKDAPGTIEIDAETNAVVAAPRQVTASRSRRDAELPDPAPWTDKLIMLVAVVAPFAGFVWGVISCWQYGWMGWGYLALLAGMYLATGLGITIGFHRLLTHKSFETYRWLRAGLMGLGALSVEGSPLAWCAIHRRHHLQSDRPGDPHSPRLSGSGPLGIVKGLCYAQFGWLFTGFWSYPNPRQYIPDLLEDRLLVAIDRLYYLWVLTSLALPAALAGLITWSWQGALLGLLWGGLVRIFLCHHTTWSVNSLCHVFGRRHFRSPDHSTNNLLVGIFALGEGWHNNHHAFPSSARHGLFWWQFDLSWLVIRTLAAVGLAWNVHVPSEKAQEAKRL